ncbi:MAG: MBL fold metallo-hydrolase [Chloroflexota bacterium]
MNIVKVGYDSTNYYVLADTKPRLLVDVGWPGTLPKLQHQCQRMDIRVLDIPYMLLTHYHPDHAGLAQELKNLGIKLLVMENQVAAIPILKTYMKPENHYVEIDPADNQILTFDNSRAFLSKLGLQGQIIATPGHSDDSITLILDDGSAFTGDLTHPMMVADDPSNPAAHSWDKIRSLGAKIIYPGHGPVWNLP